MRIVSALVVCVAFANCAEAQYVFNPTFPESSGPGFLRMPGLSMPVPGQAGYGSYTRHSNYRAPDAYYAPDDYASEYSAPSYSGPTYFSGSMNGRGFSGSSQKIGNFNFINGTDSNGRPFSATATRIGNHVFINGQ